MTDFAPPLDDISFVLRRIVQVERLASFDAFADGGLDSLGDVLSEAGRFATEVVAPTNRTGDLEGCTLVDGEVHTPTGFAKAWGQYVAAGWAAAPFAPEYGGGGLPWVVATAIFEMMTAANTAWALCPMLTHGSIHLLQEHGDEGQQATWLPRLVSGEWTGTMNLTEPQAGSDVGAVTTKAVRQPDGTYRISGQKIFITWGDHDMAGNIVHLTLARTPDAAPGTRGISCFIVPKLLLDEHGAPARPNAVTCVSLEHKMGIHGSPTCVMAFDEAEGYLIGEEQAGMRYMFTMMNNARLSVGVEGVGLGERAFQQALGFAQERHQGRAGGSKQSVAIVRHPDVRRMLLTMRSLTEAARAICYETAVATDGAEHHPDTDVARRAQERADLLTPVAKAWSTDVGNEVAHLGIQVHGGYGFVEETGAAQHARDARITTIYEGTNGIQAIDLATRKLGIRDGAALEDLCREIDDVADQLDTAGFSVCSSALAAAVGQVRTTAAWLRDHAADDVLAGATPFLRLMGHTVGAWLMGRALLALDGEDPAFAEGKRASASFFLTQLLPRAGGLVPSITAGADALATVI
jgi:alkylation response protein AidB-like acyl-CoA dehydrogenase